MNNLRRMFWVINHFFMVPAFRLGFGPVMGTPFGGYIMVIKTVGHKTGKLRWTPVNYALQDGSVHCLAGFGRIAHWYQNIKARPNIELMLPSTALAAEAQEMPHSQARLTILRKILVNSGFAAFAFGFNPFTISDSALEEKTQDYIVLRMRPHGIGSGAADPGGRLWLSATLVTIAAIWLLILVFT